MMPITLSTTETLLNLLKPSLGQAPSRGIVISTQNGLAVQVAGQKIPLPNNTTLASGQAVEVQLQSKGAVEPTVTVRALPASEAPAANQARPSNPLITLLKDVLPRVMPDTKLSAEQLQTLIPSAIPVQQSVVGVLLTLFHQQEPIGSIGAVILQLLGKAEEEGVIDSPKLANVRRSLPQNSLKDMGDWTRILKQSVSNVSRSPERIVSQMLRGIKGVDLPQDMLASNIRGLLNLPALKQYLETTGEWKTFVNHAHSMLDLLDGIQLANFRGMNYPYIFMELPLPSDSFFQRAQLHVMSESSDDAEEEEQRVDSVVIDLNTTMLGEMWIRLQRMGDTCQCQIQMVENDSISVVSAARGKLQAALKEHGYEAVSISVEPMEIGRIEQLVHLLGKSTPLDFKV
jgi:hypothetical protein